MPFDALRGVWSPVMAASELAEKPVAFTLARERLSWSVNL